MYSVVSLDINLKVTCLSHPKKHFQMDRPQPHSRPTESEFPGVGPGRCVREKLSHILRITVWMLQPSEK